MDEQEVKKFVDWFCKKAGVPTWCGDVHKYKDGHWFSYEGDICIERLIEGIKKEEWKSEG